MKPEEIFKDARLKGKARTTALATALSDNSLSISDLAAYGSAAKDTEKAVCLEAIEYATRENPKKGGSEAFRFAMNALPSKSPSVKREAGRVIANTAALNKHHIAEAIPLLLENAVHDGTVVRWSAATALAAIALANVDSKPELLVRLSALANSEKKDSIRKIYMKALKKLGDQA